ncbi:MAG: extracellular solute-binding protein, partial [Spirochaetia bacterium]|nr:extracellular solute-binding protein [Spirochaetia bacterium]
DTANTGLQKAVIQAVSGVASDTMDMFSGNVHYLHAMGVLQDMSSVDQEFGYKDADIYGPTRDDIFIDGKHYGFPCNIGLAALVVNRKAFRQFGMEAPPFRTDFETFEAIGSDFVSRANAGKKRREFFFFDNIQYETMRRSVGISFFNETLSGADLNRPEFVRILKLAKRWTEELHLVPSDADLASMSSEQGYGGSTFQLFNNGNYAMIYTGRWAMIQLRQMNAQYDISAIEYPNGGYPNALVFSRSVVAYKGSPNLEIVKQFCAFLRSEEYNLHIIKDSDGNPGEVSYLDREEFLRPVGHTNEWGLHQGLARIAKSIAFGREYSPFVLFINYGRHESRYLQGYRSSIYTAEETAKLIHDAVNEEISLSLGRNPDLKKSFEAALVKQKRIDE